MNTLAICWEAVWNTIVFICVMAGILGWFSLGVWLLSLKTKKCKVCGWIVLGLFALGVIYLIYESFAIKMCGA